MKGWPSQVAGMHSAKSKAAVVVEELVAPEKVNAEVCQGQQMQLLTLRWIKGAMVQRDR